jgi:hypothetical protein
MLAVLDGNHRWRKRRRGVIVRTWHGWTTRENADAYQQLVTTEVMPAIAARDINGLRGPDLLRRDVDTGEVEFATIMLFDDWGAVKAFAGPSGRTAVLPESARQLLQRYDNEAQNYDVAALSTNSPLN